MDDKDFADARAKTKEVVAKGARRDLARFILQVVPTALDEIEQLKMKNESLAEALSIMAISIKALTIHSRGIQDKSGLDIPWDELLDPDKHQWFDPEYDSAMAILKEDP